MNRFPAGRVQLVWRVVTTMVWYEVPGLQMVRGRGAAGGVPSSSMSVEAPAPPQCIPALPSLSVPRRVVVSAHRSRPVPALTSPCSLDEPRSAWVIPVRGHLDSIARLMAGDQYIGRGCRQRKLEQSQFCNPYKVGEYGRENAIELFEQYLDRTPELVHQVLQITGRRLVCHCSSTQSCHADALIRKFRELCPGAYDRNAASQRAPTADELNLLARHRQEPPSDDGSSADEGVPKKNSGWNYTSRDYCDGQNLASPGRWPIENRRYPLSLTWKKVAAKFTQFSEARGTPELLMALAMEKVESSPFEASEVSALKNGIIEDLHKESLELGRQRGDREDVPTKFRFLGLLLREAEDPETGLGNFAQGVRVGPGTRMPRLPALYRPKGVPDEPQSTSRGGGGSRGERQLGGGTTRRCSLWQTKCTM